MKITYFGHACFALEEDGFRVVIDPFKDVKGYKDVKTFADMVLCSHDHFDHAAVSGVKFRPSGKANPFEITMMQTFHDDCLGAKRGKNTVHILKVGDLKIVHLGDLGHTLSDRQLSFIKDCDCLMIPVGGVYTIDGDQAWELIKRVNARVTIPMHCKNGKYGLENLGSLAEFLTKSDRRIAVTTGPDFTLPAPEDAIILVPAVCEQ